MNSLSRKVFSAFGLYGLLSIVVFQFSKFLTGGIISPFWFFYMVAWICFGAIGVIVLLLRQIRVIKQSNAFLYIFVGVGNICNALYGSYLLLCGGQGGSMANFWMWLAATLIVGLLIGMDALM